MSETKESDNNAIMQDRRLLMDRSVAGRLAVQMPECDVPLAELPDTAMIREPDDLELPEVSQLEVIRYFTLLSKLNFSIDTNFYPLGSCTMKYNPKINDSMAALPGFSNIHPLQPEETVQGALELMYELQNWLGEATGLPGVGLTPLAGAQGEYAGLLIARAAMEQQSNTKRNIAIIPDSAHGTNPASAAMAGLKVETVKTDQFGNIDISDLRRIAGPDTCVLMLTIPSTLGLFEPNILEVNEIIHDVGGLVYADGANLNALLGLVKLGNLGVDICHSNLHKTFSTPHGGGGPGSGPVMVSEKLASYLPEPVITRKRTESGEYNFQLTKPQNSIGKINGFHGSFSILVRSYTYMLALGGNGLREVSQNAVINANYLQTNLKNIYDLAVDRICMHETVLSGKRQSKRGVKAINIAKRLLDYGIHAPTMYFPLIVEEALMVEPTETESKETLDRFIEIMNKIDQEIDENPEIVLNAPHTLPNTKLDEAKAARNPTLRWQP